MSNRNKHGLSRTIPPEVKFQVRKNSGWGCVICGIGIIEYEHVSPEFKNCKTHDSDKMTLLCPTCHSKKTRGFLSVSTIQKAMLNPKAKQLGFSKDVLDIGTTFPKVYFASNLFVDCKYPLIVSDLYLIRILPPETEGGPFRLSAQFFNNEGRPALFIENNEWYSYSSNWDLEVTAGRIKIKNNKNSYSLILKTIDNETIEIEHVESRINNIYLRGDKNILLVKYLDTGGVRNYAGNVNMGGNIGFKI